MSANLQYVLIDYENVQPKDLALLHDHTFKVIVFLGSNQTKIRAEFAAALQARGDNGRYFRIQGNGRNALDFHLAFHLGELVQATPTATFHIVSKDAGFDPLIEYLRDKKIAVQRCENLAAVIPMSDEQVAEVVKLLAGQSARPASVKSLTKTIANWFKTLEKVRVQLLVETLEKRGVISVDDGKVTYRLPQSQ